jgi:hypothetical protein
MKSSILLRKVLVLTFICLSIATVFIYLTPMGRNIRTVLSETISTTRYQQYAWVFGVEISEKAPPLPKVDSGNTEIPVFQGSYCWGNLGCADYAGVKTILRGKTPSVITPEANIRIAFDYKPEPTELNVQLFQDNKMIVVPLKDGNIIAPKENGIYYYGILAFWKSDDGKFSKGDTSSVFVIEVK